MMPIQRNFIEYPWRIHMIYWVASVVIWVVLSLITEGEFIEPVTNKLCYLPSQILVTYTFLLWILPLLLRRKFFKAAIVFFISGYFATALARFMKVYVYESVIGFESDKESIFEILTQADKLMVQYVIWVYMTPALTIIILMILNHIKQKERFVILQNERNAAELKFLKAQVHPHFLFNTLNNLYTLSIQRSPKTPDIAQKLYDILDYMFHRGNGKTVTLQEEIDLISNYIDLERLRYGNRLSLNFRVEVEDATRPIVPLMLLSLVENAFKHGASGDLNSPSIEIKLQEEDGKMSFEIRNSKPPIPSEDRAGYKKGIGTQNIERQLQLIYPNRFVYEVDDNENSYAARLAIELDENASSNITSSSIVAV